MSWPPRPCSARASMSWRSCLPRFGVASTLVEGTDLDAWRAAVRPNTKTAFLESPTNPTLEIIDIAAVADIMHERRRDAGGGQRVRHAAAPASAAAGGGLRRLFGDQAHRRAGPGARRRHSRERKIHRRQHPQFLAPDRPLPVAVQRLDASEVARDAAGAGRGAGSLGRADRRVSSRRGPRSCARSIPAGRTTRRRRSRGGR